MAKDHYRKRLDWSKAMCGIEQSRSQLEAFGFWTEFDRAYRQELDRIGRQIGRPLSTVEGAAFGLPGQVRMGVLPPASQAALHAAWQRLAGAN